MGIVAARARKFLSLSQRVRDPMSRMAVSTHIAFYYVPAAALISMAPQTQNPGRLHKAIRVFRCMGIVTHRTFACGKRRMKILLGIPFFFLPCVTLKTFHCIRVLNEIPGLCLRVVAAKAAPDRDRPVNKGIRSNPPVT